MAKLKEKINDLKVKFGLSDEAAREVIALYDGDMSEVNALLTEEQNKVVSWNKFWFEKQPQIEALATEYERLKGQLDTVQTTITGQHPTPQEKPQQTQNTQNVNVDEVEKRIYQNFSAVQRDLEKIRKYHFDNYKTLPDIEPIEKIIEEQRLTPWDAYQKWVAPMESERKEKELREKITKELTEQFQNDATRNGVNGYRLSNRSATTGEEVTSPLDEVLREQSTVPREQSPQAAAAAAQSGERAVAVNGPSEFELMTDFVQSMRNGRSGLAH